MSYGFHPAAEAEYLESVAFFESKRPGLGASYSQSLKESCAQSVKRHTDKFCLPFFLALIRLIG
jgi:hypothetical protein